MADETRSRLDHDSGDSRSAASSALGKIPTIDGRPRWRSLMIAMSYSGDGLHLVGSARMLAAVEAALDA